MRLKLFYSPEEITNNLYTFGKEWMTVDYTEYIGLYHTYTTGEIYTEGVWNSSKSVKLIKYESIDTIKFQYQKLKNINVNSVTPIQYQPENSITNQEQIRRFFLQKRNELDNIIEIDAKQYELYLTSVIDRNLYNSVQLTWTVTGNVDDVIINNTKQLGVISKNRIALKTAEQQMPGISKKLDNLLELYTDTDFVVPRDINIG